MDVMLEGLSVNQKAKTVGMPQTVLPVKVQAQWARETVAVGLCPA
jgi:hypothetical protein